jgi:hypothetical protein
MASRRTRGGRRRTGKGFSMLVHEYFTSREYAALSAIAVKALLDLYTQFRGNNNGDLTAAWAVMQPRGWVSKDTLSRAVHELLEHGWIVVTRQGGRRIATLYAVTWLGIDHCGGKLDVAANPVPSHAWKWSASVISLPRPSGQSAPTIGSMESDPAQLCPAHRVNGGG